MYQPHPVVAWFCVANQGTLRIERRETMMDGGWDNGAASEQGNGGEGDGGGFDNDGGNGD